MRQTLAKGVIFYWIVASASFTTTWVQMGFSRKLCNGSASAVQRPCRQNGGKQLVKGLFEKNEYFFRPIMLRAADSSKMTAAMPVLPSDCEGQVSQPPVVAGEPDCAPFAG
jgi:hypothetical protein